VEAVGKASGCSGERELVPTLISVLFEEENFALVEGLLLPRQL
jgi:hypothetical protein